MDHSYVSCELYAQWKINKRLIFTTKYYIMILGGENMIKTTAMILDELESYGNPVTKLSRLVKNGQYFPIVKGLYETDCKVPGYLLAGSIYGPSYISFDYALSYYGLIPEAVHTVTCASFEKKKRKVYKTSFGTFTYQDVPSAVFPLPLRVNTEGDYFYRIATPEKAICDKLYSLSPVANFRELESLLFDDLRVDEGEFDKLNPQEINALSEHYHSTNIRKLASFIRRRR